MNIINRILPSSHSLRKGTTKFTPKYITLHETANTSKGADALQHAKYLENGAGGRNVSWHFTCDDQRIVQHLEETVTGKHAGTSAGNAQSIGVEICINSDGNYEKALENAAQLVAYLCKKYKLGVDRIKLHKDWSGKNCPTNMIAKKRLPAFKTRVTSIMNEVKPMEPTKPAEPAKPAYVKETPGVYRIHTGTFKDVREVVTALDNMKKDFGFIVYYQAENLTFNAPFRLWTGTFGFLEEVEHVANRMKELYGWTVYVIDETPRP